GGGGGGGVPSVASRDNLRRLIGNPAQRPRPPRLEPSKLTDDAIGGQGAASDIGADVVARQRRQIHRGGGAEGGAWISRAGSELAAGPPAAGWGNDRSLGPARVRQVGELGWLGILVPSSMNGLGLGLTELALVLEQAGRGLVCEPIGLAAISAAALGLGRTPHPMLPPAMTGAA